MSEARADSMTGTNSAVLRVRTGPLAGPMLRRVVAMMLARAHCPVDRLDDAMLICDALGAHAGAHAAESRVEFTVRTRENGMELRVGALTQDGARRLAQDTSLPGIGELLTPIADEVRVEPSPLGADELVLELGFGSASQIRRQAVEDNGSATSPSSQIAGLADQAPSD